MLAILAMLARQGALCVAPGGSAPPIPSAAPRVAAVVRSGHGVIAGGARWDKPVASAGGGNNISEDLSWNSVTMSDLMSRWI